MKLNVRLTFATPEYIEQTKAYNEKLDEYYTKKDLLDADDVQMYQINLDRLEEQKPVEPKMPEEWCDVNIVDGLIIGYHVVPALKGEGREVQVIIKKRKHRHMFYVTKYSDKIIKDLDEIIEKNS